jgi:hypothetical protein
MLLRSPHSARFIQQRKPFTSMIATSNGWSDVTECCHAARPSAEKPHTKASMPQLENSDMTSALTVFESTTRTCGPSITRSMTTGSAEWASRTVNQKATLALVRLDTSSLPPGRRVPDDRQPRLRRRAACHRGIDLMDSKIRARRSMILVSVTEHRAWHVLGVLGERQLDQDLAIFGELGIATRLITPGACGRIADQAAAPPRR